MKLWCTECHVDVKFADSNKSRFSIVVLHISSCSVFGVHMLFKQSDAVACEMYGVSWQDPA